MAGSADATRLAACFREGRYSMAKIIDIKTRQELTEPRELTARQFADKLYDLEEQLNSAGMEDAAKAVRHAIRRVMPRAIEEKRRLKQLRQSKTV